MHDIKELEERWKRYRRRKYIPWIAGGFLLFVLAGAGVFFMRTDGKAHVVRLTDKVTAFFTPSEHTKRSETPQKHSTVTASYMRNGTVTALASSSSPSVSQQQSSGPLPLSPVLKRDDEEKTRNGLHIEIVESKRSGGNVYRMIEKRFKMTHDPEDGLFLARYYLKRRAYKKAEYWAFQANKIDPTLEESWLIFAEAKAKNGSPKEAIRILREYLKTHDSAKARALLKKLASQR